MLLSAGSGGRGVPRDRGLAVAGVAALAVSTTFPVVAAVGSAESLPAWVGAVDVGLAFGVIALALGIEARSRRGTGGAGGRAAVRVYRAFAAVPLGLLVVFFVAEGVRWEVLLPGLAWRSAVLLYATPAACALLGGNGRDA